MWTEGLMLDTLQYQCSKRGVRMTRGSFFQIAGIRLVRDMRHCTVRVGSLARGIGTDVDSQHGSSEMHITQCTTMSNRDRCDPFKLTAYYASLDPFGPRRCCPFLLPTRSTRGLTHNIPHPVSYLESHIQQP